MISQIFSNMHITLQTLLKHSKTHQESGFRLATKITKMLISNKINYDFIIQGDIVYFEELDKDGKIVEVVALDLSTGKYTNMDVEEYLRM
jgi:hypothetical protein